MIETLGEPRRTLSRQSRWAFLALMVAQAAHSIEEYIFRLFDVFAPELGCEGAGAAAVVPASPHST